MIRLKKNILWQAQLRFLWNLELLVALEYYLLGEVFLCEHADIEGSRFWMPLTSFLRRELPTFENYRESQMMQNIWVGPF